jgi:hypothetical protein
MIDRLDLHDLRIIDAALRYSSELSRLTKRSRTSSARGSTTTPSR